MSAQWTEASRFEIGIGPNQLQSKAQPESLWAKKVVAFLLTIFSMFRGTNCCKGRMANVIYMKVTILHYPCIKHFISCLIDLLIPVEWGGN